MSVIPPPDPATGRFLSELNRFMENPPRNLPEGAAEQIKTLGAALKGYGAESALSPGEKAAKAAAALGQQGVTDGTGQPYTMAAKNEDRPSPGQREYERVTSGE